VIQPAPVLDALPATSNIREDTNPFGDDSNPLEERDDEYGALRETSELDPSTEVNEGNPFGEDDLEDLC
jgi:hypothetical protein